MNKLLDVFRAHSLSVRSPDSLEIRIDVMNNGNGGTTNGHSYNYNAGGLEPRGPGPKFSPRRSSTRRTRRAWEFGSSRSDESSGQSTDEEAFPGRRGNRPHVLHIPPPTTVDLMQPAEHGTSYFDENIPLSFSERPISQPTVMDQRPSASFTTHLYEAFSNLFYALGKQRAESEKQADRATVDCTVPINTGETSLKKERQPPFLLDIEIMAAKQMSEDQADSLLTNVKIDLEAESILALRDLTEKQRWAIGALFVCVSDSWANLSLLQRVFEHIAISESMRQELLEIRGQGYDASLFVANIPETHRWSIVWDCLIMAVAGGQYDSRYRTSLRQLCVILDIQWERFQATEDGLAIYLRKEIDLERCTAALLESSSNGRWWKIGIGAVVGGSALMLTGGIAAPMVLPAVASATTSLGIGLPMSGGLFSLGGVQMITGLFGAAGAGLTGYKIAKRTAGVEEFGFEPIGGVEKGGGMPVFIAVSGWLVDELDDFASPWRSQYHMNAFGEHFALQWESRYLVSLGEALNGFFSRKVASVATKYWATQASTSLALAAAAMQWPLTVLSLADLIDNPWNMAADRAEKAGKILAEVLMQGVHGTRPVTLMGYSVGARLIFFCLEELARNQCKGIVENVIILGCPVSMDAKARWQNVRSVVAGRFVNAYSTSDWILLFLYRTAHFSKTVAGLAPVMVDGIENCDVTHLVKGHAKYPEAIPSILQFVGFSKI